METFGVARRSEYTQAVLNLVEEYRATRKRPMRGVPFGQEDTEPGVARDRVARMTPAEREAWVRQVRLDAALKLFDAQERP
jgi:hypothetical protein